MAQWPTEHELLDAVRGAGWLLEHHALRVLAEAELQPRSGWAFADPDEPTTSRELDVWAYRTLLQDEATKVAVSARFLVECKQSSNPYVGVGYEFPEARFRAAPSEHLFAVEKLGVPLAGRPNTVMTVHPWSHFGFDALAAEHRESNFRVTQLTRLERGKGGTWTATNEGIFTSLVFPLAKALLASKEQARGDRVGRGNNKRYGWAHFVLHFPVVLLSCPLYVVDATEAEPRVETRPWVTAARDLKSSSVTGTFAIDIVTETAFAEYVSNRLAFAQAFADKIAAGPLIYTGEGEAPAH